MVKTQSLSPARASFKAVITWLLTAFAVLLITLSGLPVVLLFFATSVPKWIASVLVLADIALLSMVIFVAATPVTLAAAAVGVIIVSLIAIALSQRFARTPSITDASGDPIVGSISVMETVKLGGAQLWITIRGRNTQNPVLLYLAGGPGSSDLAWTRRYLAALEDHFVVVNWDQPGSAKSHRAVDVATLTPARYLADAHELILHLRERFGQQKIVLVGHSWGSVLGVWLTKQYPDLFYVYVGIGQLVNATENDVLAYELALRLLDEQGNAKQAALIRKQGAPPYQGDNPFMAYARYAPVVARYMNAKAVGENGHPNLMLEILRAPEYGLLDKVNLIAGAMRVFNVVYPQLETLDLEAQASRLEIPVIFMSGRWDVNTMAVLAEQYFQHVEAPAKQMIWFERSGHLPHYEESQRFVQVMVEQVLPKTRFEVREQRVV